MRDRTAVFGLLKSELDAHTLGLSSISQLLEDCGFKVILADASICRAVDRIDESQAFYVFKSWILDNRITYLGFSYRLDPRQGLETFGKLVYRINKDSALSAEREAIPWIVTLSESLVGTYTRNRKWSATPSTPQRTGSIYSSCSM